MPLMHSFHARPIKEKSCSSTKILKEKVAYIQEEEESERLSRTDVTAASAVSRKAWLAFLTVL